MFELTINGLRTLRPNHVNVLLIYSISKMCLFSLICFT